MTALGGVSCGLFQKEDQAAAGGAQDPYYGYGQSSGDYAQVTPVDQGGGGSYGSAPSGYSGGSNPYYGYGDGSSGYDAGTGYTGGGGYSSPSPAPSPAPSYGGSGGGGGSYTVQPGDTLYGISRRHGTSVNAIKSANGLSSDLIRIGQVLAIP